MNTKKKIYIVIIILLVIGAGAAAYLIKGLDTSSDQSDQKQAPKISQTACELFTEKDAQELLGSNAKQPDATAAEKIPDRKDIPPPVAEVKTPESQKNQQTDEITSSTFDTGNAATSKDASSTDAVCIYNRGSQGPISVTVLPADAKDAKKNFDAMKVSGAKEISGYKGEAYWRSGKDASGKEYGQLGILESGGVVTIAGDSSDLDVLKKVASVVEGNLND